MPHLTLATLEAGLDTIRAAPTNSGTLQLIARRPDVEERELLERAVLDLTEGLVGDSWISRPNAQGPDGGPDPNAQITIMSARAAALVAGTSEPNAWAAAGDQLYADLDISIANLPSGSRLAIGDAILEITDEPHLGCGKFARRFGVDALKLVNSEQGRALRLRGLNARVMRPGTIATGNSVRKLA